MGCSHCMNNATSMGKHMSFETFKKVVDFHKKYRISFFIISGGEPTEHPDFKDFLLYALKELPNNFITVTTNGIWMLSNSDFIKEMNDVHGSRLIFQVTNDERYYPVRLDCTHPVFSTKNVIVCNKVEHIYPQGRALYNNLEWDSKASKCFNIRAIANQVKYKDLGIIIGMLAVKNKFCTPHINIDGYIKLGESDLCPICSHIDKENNEIVNDIINFRCDKCNLVNDNLPKEYRKIIGEA